LCPFWLKIILFLSVSSCYHIEKNPSEQYKNNRLTIGKNSAFVPLDEARKAEQKLQQKAAKQKSGGRTL